MTTAYDQDVLLTRAQLLSDDPDGEAEAELEDDDDEDEEEESDEIEN